MAKVRFLSFLRFKTKARLEKRPSRLAGEEGVTLVMVAVWLMVLALFLALVVDLGNWYVHKRHLQSQADAGALAGGGLYSYPCYDDKIANQARRYSGDPTKTGYNAQVDPAGSVVVLLNSDKYYNEGGSDYSDGGAPCATQFLDVKITESDVPVFFAGLLPGISPTVNAHARVTLMNATHRRNMLPISVQDSQPRYMRAEFVDEGTGSVVASAVMSAEGVVNGYYVWSNATTPVAVSVSERVGVRLVVSGSDNTACGQYLVVCYEKVLFVRGWSGSGEPALKDVRLTPGSCGDGYHVYLEAGTSCAVGVEAEVDFPEPPPPPPPPPGEPTPPPVDPEPSLTATLGKTTINLSQGAGDSWSGTGLPVAADGGPLEVTLDWTQKNGVVNGQTCPCSGSFGVVQRVFAGGFDVSGPLRIVQLSPPGGLGGFNSMPQGSHDLVVRVGLEGLHEPATSASSKPVVLRAFDPKTSSLDCDPAVPNLRDEIVQSCQPVYRINSDPYVECEDLPAGPPTWPQPWPCIRLQPGASVGQAVQGLTDRILKGEGCAAHPNNWSNFPNIDFANDTRVVTLYVVPFGTLSSSPNAYVSVLGFADFYVTGWGRQPPCPGDQAVQRGMLIGHFVKRHNLPNFGASGPCVQTSLNPCVAVLTH